MLRTSKPREDASPDAGRPAGILPLASACRLLTGYGNGGGFLLTHDGLVATCAHGVFDGQTIRVELADETLHTGRVVAFRPERDLALVMIDGVAGLPHVTLGDPRDCAPGSRFHIVGFDQLPESALAPIYLPTQRRVGRFLGPMALEVGFAGMMEVYAQGDDPAFDCALTTRTNQIRPGYSGAMVCAPDGRVVGVHTAALELGGFGQEISAVELAKLVAEHGHKPGRTSKTPKIDPAASDRWDRVLYAMQCMELDRRNVERGPESHRSDLERIGEESTEDPEIRIAQAYAHRELEEWTPMLARAQEAVTLGGISASRILRDYAEYGNVAEILRFFEACIGTMPEVDRRLLLRTRHLELLNDGGEFETATKWGTEGEEDAYGARNAADFLLAYAKALHGAGRQEEADTWLRRAVWARDASELSKSEISRIAADSADPRTQWYAMRQGFSALTTGDGGTSVLEPMARLAQAKGATEAAAVFGSLAQAFGPKPAPASEPTSESGGTDRTDEHL